MKTCLFLLVLIIGISGCGNKSQGKTESEDIIEEVEILPEEISQWEDEDVPDIFDDVPLEKLFKNLPDLSGIWVYEKSDVYGGYENGGDYGVSKEELHEHFKDITLEFFQRFVCLNNRTNCTYYQPEMWDIESFFSSKLGEEETAEQIRTQFKETFGVTMGDSVLLYDLPHQKYPYNRLLIFPEKILMFEYGAFYASFVRTEQMDYDGANKHRAYNLEMENYHTWYYEGKTIKDVYLLLEVGEGVLEKEMPVSDLYVKGKENTGEPTVRYSWITPERLDIMAYYGGGQTSYELIQDREGTELIVHYSAD